MLVVILAIVQIVLVAAVIVFLFFQTRRPAPQDSSAELLSGLAGLRNSSERLEGKVSDEMRTLRDDNFNYSQQARQESAADARSLREELLANVDRFGTQLCGNIADFRRDQVSADNQFRDGVTTQVDRLVSSTAADSLQLREGMQEKFGGLQDQVVGQLDVTAASELLKPCDARQMRCFPVSTRINHVANDDEECSAPVELAQIQDRLFS